MAAKIGLFYTSASILLMSRLPLSFFRREPVTTVAKDLLGTVLVVRSGDDTQGVIIVETEAYSWTERGCHAYRNKRTARNATMFSKGGLAYVYRCYGIHCLLNLVTGPEGCAEAVLIRAVQPLGETGGISHPELRRKYAGPGRLTRSLGIEMVHDGCSLCGPELWLEEPHPGSPDLRIDSGPRIGIDYAGADALLPWRFWIRDNAFVSR